MKNMLMFEPAERKYAIKKSDPAYGMFRYIAVGFDTLEKGKIIGCPQPSLNTLAIEMTLSGAATLYYGAKKIIHEPRSLMLMLPELKFKEVADQNWSSCWFVLWGSMADTFVTTLNRSSQAILLKNIPGNIHLNMLETCRLMLHQPAEWQWAWLNNLTCVLDYVRQNVTAKNERRSSLISDTYNLMEKYLDIPMSLPEIAEKLSMSLSSFSHKFKVESGISPAMAYRQMRIDKAKQLLVDGLSVTETSEKMGFENPFHFSRVFKQIEGISPSKFKQQAASLSLKNN